MPTETRRRRERRDAAWAVKNNTAVRREMSPAEAAELFDKIERRDLSGLGIRRLGSITLDTLLEPPQPATGEAKMTVLAYAAWFRRDMFVQKLLWCGADPSFRYDPVHQRARSCAGASGSIGAVPPQYAAWIMRAVVRMRQHAKAVASSTPCAACTNAVMGGSLEWAPCKHVVCEQCAWTKMAEMLHAQTEATAQDQHPPSFVCPCCALEPSEELQGGSEPNGVKRRARHPGQIPKGPNDWVCPECGFNNFNRRCVCHQCGHDRPGRQQRTLVDQSLSLPHVSEWQEQHRQQCLELFMALPQEATTGRTAKQDKFRALSAAESVSQWLGHSRAQRSSEMHKAAASGNLARLCAVAQAGVDVDVVDAYGQSALMLAAGQGQLRMVQILLERLGADPTLCSHGNCSAAIVAACNGHDDVLRVLEGAGASLDACGSAGISAREYREKSLLEPGHALQVPSVITPLIPVDAQHPGGSSCYIDHGFSESCLQALEQLWRSLPVAPCEKVSPTSRSYYCDAEGWVRSSIAAAVEAASDCVCTEALAHMRFLHYSSIGGCLPPHTDLSRTDAAGRTSTHTFILYLADCSAGGETVLLQTLEGESIVKVAPRRGRLLLFPHMCPHEALPVLQTPKLLLRGEMHSSWKGPRQAVGNTQQSHEEVRNLADIS